MPFAQHDDTDLLRLARGGSQPAFAVLLRRHAHRVAARSAGGLEGDDAVVAVFRALMRALDQVPVGTDGRADVGAAVDALADRLVGTDAAGHVSLSDERMDRIWARLAVLWPNGRPRRRVPSAVPRAAFVAFLVALGFALPYVVLTSGDDGGEPDLDDLVARPYTSPEAEDDAPADEAPPTETDEVPALPPLRETDPDQQPGDQPAAAPATWGGDDTADTPRTT